MDVDPIRRPRGNVASEAVFLIVGCHLLIGRIGLEQCPSPTVTLERTVGVPTFFVLDQYEPDFRPRGPMRVAGGHLCVIRAEHFLDQNCTDASPGSAEAYRRTWVENYIGTKGLVAIANVRWLASFRFCRRDRIH